MREKVLMAGVKPGEHLHRRPARGVRATTCPERLCQHLDVASTCSAPIARPLIAKTQIDIARKVSADVVSYGSTGKVVDRNPAQVAYYALELDIRVIAPWRADNFFKSREAMLAHAEQHQIPIARDKRGEAVQRRRQPAALSSGRAKCWRTGGRGYRVRLPAHDRRDGRTRRRSLAFEGRSGGDRRRAAVAGGAAGPGSMSLATPTGSAGLDLVENRFVGIKSRGVYETPGAGPVLPMAPAARVRSPSTSAPTYPKDELDARYAGADLQRLLVHPERDAAGGDHHHPRSGSPARCGEALQQCRHHLAAQSLTALVMTVTRGRQGRRRPPRRLRHQAQRPALP